MHEMFPDENEVPRLVVARFSDDSLTFESTRSKRDWTLTLAHPALGSFSITGLPIQLSEADVHALALEVGYKLLELLGAGTKAGQE
jgi:hypothetical protein